MALAALMSSALFFTTPSQAGIFCSGGNAYSESNGQGVPQWNHLCTGRPDGSRPHPADPDYRRTPGDAARVTAEIEGFMQVMEGRARSDHIGSTSAFSLEFGEHMPGPNIRNWKDGVYFNMLGDLTEARIDENKRIYELELQIQDIKNGTDVIKAKEIKDEMDWKKKWRDKLKRELKHAPETIKRASANIKMVLRNPNKKFIKVNGEWRNRRDLFEFSQDIIGYTIERMQSLPEEISDYDREIAKHRHDLDVYHRGKKAGKQLLRKLKAELSRRKKMADELMTVTQRVERAKQRNIAEIARKERQLKRDEADIRNGTTVRILEGLGITQKINPAILLDQIEHRRAVERLADIEREINDRRRAIRDAKARIARYRKELPKAKAREAKARKELKRINAIKYKYMRKAHDIRFKWGDGESYEASADMGNPWPIDKIYRYEKYLSLQDKYNMKGAKYRYILQERRVSELARDIEADDNKIKMAIYGKAGGKIPYHNQLKGLIRNAKQLRAKINSKNRWTSNYKIRSFREASKGSGVKKTRLSAITKQVNQVISKSKRNSSSRSNRNRRHLKREKRGYSDVIKRQRDLVKNLAAQSKYADQVKQFKKEVRRLQGKPGTDFNRRRIAYVRRRVREAQAKLDAVNAKLAGRHQVMDGLPPDVDLIYRLKHIRWWTNADVNQSNYDHATSSSKTTQLSTMFGGSLRLGQDSGIGFGFGYSNGNSTNSTPTTKGKADSSTFNMILNGYKGIGAGISVDVTGAFGYNWHDSRTGTTIDKYNTQNLGLGIGFNKSFRLGQLYTAETRLGYSHAWSFRDASTDSAAVRHASTTNSFGRATLSGVLRRKLEGGGGYLFAEGKVTAVAYDDSSANQDKKPFEAEIGAGFRARLGEVAELTARGFYGGIGRKAKESYGGSLNLGFAF